MTESVPMRSVREQVADALMERVLEIQKVNGFNTDAGVTVVLGQKVRPGESDPDTVLQVTVGVETVATWQAGKVFYKIPYVFEVISRAGRAESWRDAERLLQDVKRAVELPDTTLDGLLEHPGLERSPARTLERDPGAEDVGIEITYFACVQESWGSP